MTDAIISIKPKFVADILSGRKKVELRRRRVHLNPGSRLWIYSTLPTGAFQALAVIKAIHYGTSEELRKFLDAACVTEKEYQEYFRGADVGCAIEFAHITQFGSPLSLYQAKKISADFHPPQFFTKLPVGSRLFAALETRVA